MPESLHEQIAAFTIDKQRRYAAYEQLLRDALRAGTEAALGYVPHPGAAPRRGAVWLQLADGRSSFARFLRVRDDGLWRHHRRMGTYMPVRDYGLDLGLVYAEAVRHVLAEGGVEVSVESDVVTGPDVNSHA